MEFVGKKLSNIPEKSIYISIRRKLEIMRDAFMIYDNDISVKKHVYHFHKIKFYELEFREI